MNIMASSRARAQEVIKCDFCDKPTVHFCNSCQKNLCKKCVLQHVTQFQSLSHDIVHYKNKKLQLVFLECKLHPGQRCEVQCQQCETPICVRCLIGSHKSHDAVELLELVQIKREEIQKETKEIEERIVPDYNKTDANLQVKLDEITTEFCKNEQERERLRILWHKKVDKIFDALDYLNNSVKERNLETITSSRTKIKTFIQCMNQTVKKNKQILKSNKASDFADYSSKLNEYKDVLTDLDVQMPSLIGKEVEGKELTIEMEDFKAILTHKLLFSMENEVLHPPPIYELLEKPSIVAYFPTEFSLLGRLACVGEKDAWIIHAHQHFLRINIHGSVEERFTDGSAVWPDIAVNNEGELVYSNIFKMTVNIVRQGKSKTLIEMPEGWVPDRLCCTRSGDILVCVSSNSQRKIFRYHETKITQTVDKDENGKPILKNGEVLPFMTENNNEDICVSDTNANEAVILSKKGRVRFRYNGTPAKTRKPFCIRDLVTDPLNQIIVADYNNSCLHILDQNGQFLKCVDNCELDQISSLSIDGERRLWAGLSHTGKIKVIQYLK